jgi:hypothetical protein
MMGVVKADSLCPCNLGSNTKQQHAEFAEESGCRKELSPEHIR